MSNLSNDAVLERVGDLTDSDMLTKEQLEFIQRCMDIGDIEGLWYMLPMIEQDVEDRISKEVRYV